VAAFADGFDGIDDFDFMIARLNEVRTFGWGGCFVGWHGYTMV
jgi:hypothetical protein